nr:MAG TPA: hypothetical protein [Caudoviricetes sp.]
MTLEINSCKNYEILEVRQGDKGSRIIDFAFTVNGETVNLTSTMSAKVNATVDDVIVADSVTAVVDTENNVVTVTLTDTMLELSGICKMDIVLTEGDEIITAETVCLRIGKSVINDDSKAFPGASSIAEITKEVETARGSSSTLNARLNGIDSAVINKAEKSTVSQLSARMQSAETSLAGKANTSDVANALKQKEDNANKVSSKTDITDSRVNYPSIEYLGEYYYDANETYSSAETDKLLGDKANVNSVYSKVEADNLLGGKADKADVSKLKDDIGDRNITLDFNYDGYIDKKGKFNTLVSFKTTDFIAISSRVIVKGEFRDLNSPLYYINCYDSNKNYLGGTINAISSGNKIVNVNGVVTLIEGTCFIRVTNSRRSISMVKMGYSLSDTGDLSSVNQKIEESKTNNSIYSNIINDGLGFSVFSKFASVGDSLSVGYNTEKDGTPISEDLKHSWGAYIEKRCGTKSFWTGKSGQTCKTWLNTTSETWGLNYCKSIGTMPLYVICMGANESGINIGTTDDIDTDNDTLYGYVSKVINELRNISPKSYIVCTGVSREQNSPSINDVYKTICELKEKCYYLDCFKEFNSEPFTSYFFNWHYSANGYSAMANLFDYKLKEVMAKNVEDFKYVNEADN